MKFLKYLLLAVWAAVASYAAFQRLQSEREDKTVEVCVSWKDTREMIGREPPPADGGTDGALVNFLERCRIVGVRTLAVQEDLPEAVKPLGFSLAALLDARTSSVNPLNPAKSPELCSAWVILPEAPDFSALGLYFARDLSAAVERSQARLALFENQPKSYEQVRDIVRSAPRHAVRAHTISQRELINLSEEEQVSRWVRAVKERSCRFLYYPWNPELNSDDNLAVLRGARQTLQAGGFSFSRLPAPSKSPFLEPGFLRGRMALAWMAAALAPLAGLSFVGRRLHGGRPGSVPGIFAAWLAASAFAILGGLTVSFLLPDTVFLNGLEVFRGVKAALLLPLFAAGAFILDKRQKHELLNRKVSVKDILLLTSLLAAAWVMTARSGNFSSLVSGLEAGVRESLEKFMGVRPRFKEFLIGHPLMILGIYLIRTQGAHTPKGNYGYACLWAGSLGLISIANSFCHLHTPLSVTLLRTFHGLWLGALCALGALSTYEFFSPGRKQVESES